MHLFTFSASFAAHLTGEMYQAVVKSHGNFSTTCSVSGDATGTGKSLIQSTFMATFRGDDASNVGSITEAMIYEMLSEGQNIYGKLSTRKHMVENDGSPVLFRNVIFFFWK